MLKIYDKKSKVVSNLISRVPGRVFATLQKLPTTQGTFKAYIKVTYPLGSTYWNDGWFETREDGIAMWRAFTDINLIRSFNK